MKFRFDIEGIARNNFWETIENGDTIRFFGDELRGLPLYVMGAHVTTGRNIRKSLLKGAKRKGIRYKIELEGLALEGLLDALGGEDPSGEYLYNLFRTRFGGLPISIQALSVTTGGFIRNTILSGKPEEAR